MYICTLSTYMYNILENQQLTKSVLWSACIVKQLLPPLAFNINDKHASFVSAYQ